MSEEIRIEYPSAGATYNRSVYGVYRYSRYPRGSVLAGQESRSLLDQFDTLKEAKAKYPRADTTGCGFRPIEVGIAPPNDFDPSYAGERWNEEDA